ncbi:uncharacterized protein LOC131902141 isoform X2 [Peromyscus eremicus]|uniref:uncharacterized protein LOC131902141 isoform X2 n=1 Tax=Peromyscus eremicus TaxID=42410 RepID=UPI0027DC89E6|nr:uncharacterized protein LOC131902141 isoform X2 [Peromyscus eremicus]
MCVRSSARVPPGGVPQRRGGGASTDPTPTLQRDPIGWGSLGASQSALRVVFFLRFGDQPSLLQLSAAVDSPAALLSSFVRPHQSGEGKMPTFPWMLDVEAQMPPPGEWKTPPFDPRFPNQNQTRNCYQNFLDYHRCVKNMSRRGKNTQPCEYYYRVFHSLCPISWVQRWTEQIKQGTFPGKI